MRARPSRQIFLAPSRKAAKQDMPYLYLAPLRLGASKVVFVHAAEFRLGNEFVPRIGP